MAEGPYIAEIGALIGDPARANILTALMEGRALTASELAFQAQVSPQTTSSHLARLLDGGLIALEKQGRHRYYRLATPAVAEVLETMMGLAQGGPGRHRPKAKSDDAIRKARTCYDHVAGQLGVALAKQLTKRGQVILTERETRVTKAGERFLSELGIDLEPLKAQRRPLLRSCLDWSERQPHVAGSLGAAMAERFFELGWVKRPREGRGLVVTPLGVRGFRDKFDVDAANQ
jgi:DNA-binding transcriptional ArsR family regulator